MYRCNLSLRGRIHISQGYLHKPKVWYVCLSRLGRKVEYPMNKLSRLRGSTSWTMLSLMACNGDTEFELLTRIFLYGIVWDKWKSCFMVCNRKWVCCAILEQHIEPPYNQFDILIAVELGEICPTTLLQLLLDSTPSIICASMYKPLEMNCDVEHT
jgi:hypothetical protein